MLFVDIKSIQHLNDPFIFTLQSMYENPLVFHELFIFKHWGTQKYAICIVRKFGRILGLTSYFSHSNGLTPRKVFVTIQATPHQPFFDRRLVIVKKYNDVPYLHMYRFIIKATNPALFIRFARM